MKKIFLTGMMRSGTTLLQKALNQHPEILLSYQNRTKHFHNEIKCFHEERNINKYHLLSHYSPNIDYTFQDCQTWLNKNTSLDELLPENNCLYSGVKEVLAEEFLPFFIINKTKCINIIRDPRDVISSMSFGNGVEHTGLERPVLFDIKNWRKSVLVSQILKDSEYLLTIRMEDLLEKPELTMEKIYNYLGVSNISFTNLIEKMNDLSWKGNSSFGEKKAFDLSAVGNYKVVLPTRVIKYIEATCNHEMTCMGYNKAYPFINKSIFSSYLDPFVVKRDEFDSDYSSNTENVAYELARSLLSIDELITHEFLGHEQ
jgi:hypothetical protein